jgi:hypothetical protein
LLKAGDTASGGLWTLFRGLKKATSEMRLFWGWNLYTPKYKKVLRSQRGEKDKKRIKY